MSLFIIGLVKINHHQYYVEWSEKSLFIKNHKSNYKFEIDNSFKFIKTASGFLIVYGLDVVQVSVSHDLQGWHETCDLYKDGVSHDYDNEKDDYEHSHLFNPTEICI